MRALFLVCLFLRFAGLHAQVSIDSSATDEGLDAFFVSTPFYSLYLQKDAGGFSSLCGPDGTDWIGYRNGKNEYPASAASSFRGIPNLVYGGDDSGIGHPGFGKCNSRQEGDSTVLVNSLSGKWQIEYRFYTNYIVIDVTKQDSLHPYWFLYEGVPGGTFDPGGTYWGTETITYTTIAPDYYSGKSHTTESRYVWFGYKKMPYRMFLAMPKRDTLPELLGFIGDKGNWTCSTDGMVVWGFGRGDDATPLLTGRRQLIIGFHDGRPDTISGQQRIKTYIESILAKYEENGR